ncbi:type II toxin-antitoxin system RelE/ParE family toxin [Streptomyces sp. NPDC050848]|uniref:type II toxin-antitoxin system RelE family toxin n=1 Tax=Streptomyces sp. NPDC050848 TaxID=3155791 RepID=UPI0033F6563A
MGDAGVPPPPYGRSRWGQEACVSAVGSLADQPRPSEARPLGGSGYYRLSVGDRRVLYRPDDATITVYVVKVGRVA